MVDGIWREDGDWYVYSAAVNGIKLGVRFNAMIVDGLGEYAYPDWPWPMIIRGKVVTDTSATLSVSGGALIDDSWTVNVAGPIDETYIPYGGAALKFEPQNQALVSGALSVHNLSMSLSGLADAGATITLPTIRFVYPAKQTAVPLPVTGLTAARVSDTAIHLGWTVPSQSSGRGIQGYSIWRWDNVTNKWWDLFSSVSKVDPAEIYANLGLLAYTPYYQSGSAQFVNGYTDITAQDDRQYAYIVISTNIMYNSANVQSGYVYTTPKAPTNFKARMSGTSNILTWTNNTAIGGATLVIERSTNGGAYVQIATPAEGTVTYTDPGLSPLTNTYTYRIKAVAGGVASSVVVSNTVPVQQAPSAPKVTAPQVLDLATQALTINIAHNSKDTSLQAAGNLRYRLVGAASWTTIAIGTAAAYTFPAGTLPNSATPYEFQAQTKGDHADYSAWSGSVLVNGSTAPTVVITYPGATLAFSKLSPIWSYYDPEGSAQSAFRLKLIQAGNVVYDNTFNGSDVTYGLPLTLLNNTTYTLEVFVKDGAGQWSDAASKTFLVDYLYPPQPELELNFDKATGAVVAAITIPAPLPSEVMAVTQTLFRQQPDGSWVEAMADVPVNHQATITRRNLAVDPRGKGTVDRLHSVTSGAATPTSNEAVAGMDEPTAWKSTVTTAGTFTMNLGSSKTFGIVAGQAYTVSMQARSTVDLTSCGLVVQWFDNADSSLGSATYQAAALGANTTGRKTAENIVAPAGATRMRAYITATATWAIGNALYVTAVLEEQAATYGGYFSGSTVQSVQGAIYSWEDPLAPDNVASILTVYSDAAAVASDPIPPLMSLVNYKVVAYSISPTARESAEGSVSTMNDRMAFLNAGPGFGVLGVFLGSPRLSMNTGRPKVLHTFAGRTKPLEFIGKERKRSYSVSGLAKGLLNDCFKGMDPWTAWETLGDMPAPLCYRDPRGVRKFCSISDVAVDFSDSANFATVSFTLTEVDHDES